MNSNQLPIEKDLNRFNKQVIEVSYNLILQTPGIDNSLNTRLGI